MTTWTHRIGAYVVCVEDERVLLVRLINNSGLAEWTLPGGGVDPGEDPYDTAIREFHEETGHTVVIDRLLGVDSTVQERNRSDGNSVLWHGIRIVYTGRITGGELRDEVGGSTDTAQWFPLAEIGALPTVTLVDGALRLYREQPADGHCGH
ncbi:NUDIX hydrolase [Labedaea rhizosphaerae]|uniref:ADP-ribose pyrophosphatase YjhB (NUDIX family) n=1 Tax=Labedaea rhizosphaerae TaxID=598644 RepID=A0A4V3CX93_LABRH|nr:NUDIX hydrolase [Labedaea rhizosphaerae]TDP89388.1 ADP-ribose pyrophosphatase YjhB (NUDIX family) [Labedaea rhizosphaerae]